MPTIDTDAEAHWVVDAWTTKTADLRLRDVFKKKHRGIAGVALLAFATTGVMLAAAVDSATAGDLTGAGFGVLLAAAGAGLGLDSLDLLDCELRENHQCRRCRKATDRWKADEHEEDR